MSKIHTITNIFPLVDKVEKQLRDRETLEDAAQRLTDTLYQEFDDSFVLVRLFATVPFGQLPPANRNFVAAVSKTRGIANLVKDETLVLSLLGTRGRKPAWDHRLQSQAHIGIPLASATFIDKIPMMARLLKEVGLDLSWIDAQKAITTKTFAGLSGVFHVLDARTAVDNQGRKIISAQDFVDENNVKTVFGLASGYPSDMTFVTLIAFCHETIEKSRVELLLPLINSFKVSTVSLVLARAIFA